MAAPLEAEHIARVLDGDRAAFDALYEALLPAAWRIATARRRERPAAEALARSILRHAFRHLADRPEGRDLVQWLERVADDVSARRRAPARDARPAAGDPAGG
jgi:DNA-directed RNA polymerase specialized sigma24 family protein